MLERQKRKKVLCAPVHSAQNFNFLS